MNPDSDKQFDMADMDTTPDTPYYAVDIENQIRSIKILLTTDNTIFEVPTYIAMISGTIKNMMSAIPKEDLYNEVIPISNITSKNFKLILEMCEYYYARGFNQHMTEDELKEWKAKPFDDDYKDFFTIDKTDKDKLENCIFDMINDLNYLDIKYLFDMCCKSVAMFVKNNTPEELYNLYNLKPGDITQEEVEEVYLNLPVLKNVKLPPINTGDNTPAEVPAT